MKFAVEQVQKLIEEGFVKEDILFLYRRSKMYSKYFEAFKKSGLIVSGKTIHGAKGLEAKAVFIVGLTEGKGGFPDVWLSDVIFQLIKETDHDILMEEERRLFYVALTRAKDHLFLLSQKDNPSSFINEIPLRYRMEPRILDDEVLEFLTCDHCKHPIKQNDNFCAKCGTSLKILMEEDIKAEENEKDDKELILECVRDLKFDVGVNYLSNILKGSKTVLVNGNNPEDFTNYGVFKLKRVKDIKKEVLILIEEGLLTNIKGAYGNLKVKLAINEIKKET